MRMVAVQQGCISNPCFFLRFNGPPRPRGAEAGLRGIGRDGACTPSRLPAFAVVGRGTAVVGLTAVDGRAVAVDGRATAVDGRAVAVDGRATADVDRMVAVAGRCCFLSLISEASLSSFCCFLFGFRLAQSRAATFRR